MKIAIIYDRVNKWGGAERVLLALNKIFPEAVLFTSVFDAQKASWAEFFPEVKTTFLQKSSLIRDHHELFALLMPVAFETLDLREFDVVISVTSEAAKGVITPPHVKHICICLTPTRYLWSGYSEYFKNPLLRLITRPFIWYLRKWDRVAASRPDEYIAISRTVQERISKYYDRESVVIFPSVDKFTATNSSLEKRLRQEKYFLLVSRLSHMTPYKRVDLAIQAANQLGLPLKIVGEGSSLNYLKQKAGSTIEFLGKLTDMDLFTYYKYAQALIFPGEEDFGLVMVEAQLAGTPVIAYRAGGALEIINDRQTGEFFDEPTASSLIKVLKSFHRDRYNTDNCIRNGSRFSFQSFKREIERIVQ